MLKRISLTSLAPRVSNGLFIISRQMSLNPDEKPNPFAKKPKPTYAHVSRIGREGSLIHSLHQKRMAEWTSTEPIPEDIEHQPKLWPSAKCLSGSVAYRKLWLNLDYPTYWTVVRTKDKEGVSSYYGVSTVRGITLPNIRKIPSARKDDWVILPQGQVPTCDFWSEQKQKGAVGEAGAEAEALADVEADLEASSQEDAESRQ